MPKLLRLIALIQLLAMQASSQSYYFRRYEVESGLSHNTVFCSVQDKKGFLWFGTKDGLNRFDGYHFKVFHIRDNEDERSFDRDQVSAIAVDSTGKLWVGSQKGLFWLDEEREQLIPFLDSLRDVNEIYIDSKNQLWFNSVFTAHCYNFTSGKLITYPPADFFTASSFFEYQGDMWFASINGFIHRLNTTTGKFASYNIFAHSPRPEAFWIDKIAAGNKNDIYIGTSAQGIKVFDIATSSYRDLLTYNTDKTTIYVRDILKTAGNECWFATESGIFLLNTDSGKFTHLRKKYLDPYSISDNAVYTLCKDREGGIWAGTYFGGLNYTPKQLSASFQKYFPDYGRNSITGNVVREICEDGSGNIWLATEDDGLNKIETSTGLITQFKTTGLPGSIAYSNIHGLLVNGNDLWIGTFEHGIDIMDIRTGKVKKHYISGPGPYELKSNFVVTFLKTRNGDIYAGSSNGVFKYVPGKDHFIPAEGFPPGGFISCMIEDEEGTIWTGQHSSGIYYYNPGTREKGHLFNQPENRNSLTTNTVNAIFQDSNHEYWFAMEGGGLCRYSKSRNLFKRFTDKDGLPSNFVFKVLEDNRKTIWVTTSKGLLSMDLNGENKNVFTRANGLLNDQFNYNSGFKDSRGKLYFGSVRGMISFNPEVFKKSSYTPPVYITAFQVHNKELPISKDSSVLHQSIIVTNEIELSHHQSSFSIDFAALSFTSPEMTEYEYIMEGLDKDWTHIKSNRKVYFTNLKPGSYTFRVKAHSHEFSGNLEKSLQIEIKPPFWATAWAYLLYTLLAGSLLIYLVRVYHNMQESKKEKEIYEAKIEFFVNIAHEIKTPLTLIKGPVENLSDLTGQIPAIKEDVQMMERNTNRLVNLVNQIMDFRQTETKRFSLDFSLVNMNELLQEAYLTFEPLARKKNLSYSIQLPAVPVYNMADAEALNKIFSNLFSNAVKYGEKHVSVQLIQPQTDNGMLTLLFSNDGYLIPEEMKEKIFEPFYRLKETMRQKGTGIGLALARSLVELHGGNIYLKQTDVGMNVFVLELPYHPIEKNTNIHTKPEFV